MNLMRRCPFKDLRISRRPISDTVAAACEWPRLWGRPARQAGCEGDRGGLNSLPGRLLSMSWDQNAVREALERHEHRKRQDADDCRSKARSDPSYRSFHDYEHAEEMMAFVLKTNAALGSRARFMDRLSEMERDVREGAYDTESLFSQREYRRYAVAFLKRLREQYSE